MTIIITTPRGNLTLTIKPDSDAENPRAWGGDSFMICVHRRYNLGDWKRAKQRGLTDPDAIREYVESLDPARSVALPLYLYDHSGLSMSTKAYACPWDSGQVGFIVHEASHELTPDERERITANLRINVEVYSAWLAGDFCGYVLEDEDGDEVDSCWGFASEDTAREYAQEVADSWGADLKTRDDHVNAQSSD